MAFETGTAPEKSFRVDSATLCLKELDSGLLAVIDAKRILRFVDPKQRLMLGSSRLLLAAALQPLAIDISRKGDLCIGAEPGVGRAEICSVKGKRLLCEAGNHFGAITQVRFDPLGHYAVTAGDDGKAAAWEPRSGSRLFNLPPHADGVTAVAISETGSRVATGSFDRLIQVSQPGSMRPPLKLRGHGAAVTALHFAGEGRLVSGDRMGGVLLWDLSKGELLRRLETAPGGVVSLCSDETSGMLFAATDGGAVALYDLQDLETVNLHYLRFSAPLSAMTYCPLSRRLAVGTEAGGVHLFDLFAESVRLKAAAQRQDFDAIYTMARTNPVVRFLPSYKSMEAQWRESVEGVDALIAADRVDAAEMLLLPFAGVRAKGKEVAALRERIEMYRIFRSHVENRRYAVAYDLAFKFPLVRRSECFRRMEGEWVASYERAARLLRNRKREKEGVALLAPFRGISEKTAPIRTLLEESRRYLLFKELVARKDWKRAWDLVRNHPQLERSDVYRSLLDIGDKLFISAQKAYSAGEYKSAEAACKTLLAFPDYREEAAALLERIKP